MQKSMSLEYEPSSEPLHISVKQLFLNCRLGVVGRLEGSLPGEWCFLTPHSVEREGFVSSKFRVSRDQICTTSQLRAAS